jgi:hypothetical protein
MCSRLSESPRRRLTPALSKNTKPKKCGRTCAVRGILLRRRRQNLRILLAVNRKSKPRLICRTSRVPEMCCEQSHSRRKRWNIRRNRRGPWRRQRDLQFRQLRQSRRLPFHQRDRLWLRPQHRSPHRQQQKNRSLRRPQLRRRRSNDRLLLLRLSPLYRQLVRYHRLRLLRSCHLLRLRPLLRRLRHRPRQLRPRAR